MTTSALAARISFLSTVVLDSGFLLYLLIFCPQTWYSFLLAFLAILIGSFPVLIVMAIILPIIRRLIDSFNNKIYLTILTCGGSAFTYGFISFILDSS
jgi:hypothetical protein